MFQIYKNAIPWQTGKKVILRGQAPGAYYETENMSRDQNQECHVIKFLVKALLEPQIQ